MAERMPSPRDSRECLLQVATGQLPADLVVRGGRLADVYTGELLDGWGVRERGLWDVRQNRAVPVILDEGEAQRHAAS